MYSNNKFNAKRNMLNTVKVLKIIINIMNKQTNKNQFFKIYCEKSPQIKVKKQQHGNMNRQAITKEMNEKNHRYKTT